MGHCGFVEGHLADSPGRKVRWHLEHIITGENERVGVGEQKIQSFTNKIVLLFNESQIQKLLIKTQFGQWEVLRLTDYWIIHIYSPQTVGRVPQVGRRDIKGKSTCKYLRYGYAVNRLRLCVQTMAGNREAMVKRVSNVQWTHCHTPRSSTCDPMWGPGTGMSYVYRL